MSMSDVRRIMGAIAEVADEVQTLRMRVEELEKAPARRKPTGNAVIAEAHAPR